MTAAATASPYDPRVVERVIAERRHLDGALMPILHGVQDALGWVPADAVPRIAEALNLSRAEVHGVISYYHHFRESPSKGPVLQVCRAEACRSVGGEALLAQAQAAGGCSVEPVYCLGLCAMSPAVMLQGQPHARMTPARLADLLSDVAGI
ncbi:MAG: formate dehydrogenase [Betaproteobacteria bacterium]|nr:MAG: formate dehydrogenase [Betaproteobacteria bacterium]